MTIRKSDTPTVAELERRIRILQDRLNSDVRDAMMRRLLPEMHDVDVSKLPCSTAGCPFADLGDRPVSCAPAVTTADGQGTGTPAARAQGNRPAWTVIGCPDPAMVPAARGR